MSFIPPAIPADAYGLPTLAPTSTPAVAALGALRH